MHHVGLKDGSACSFEEKKTRKACWILAEATRLFTSGVFVERVDVCLDSAKSTITRSSGWLSNSVLRLQE